MRLKSMHTLDGIASFRSINYEAFMLKKKMDKLLSLNIISDKEYKYISDILDKKISNDLNYEQNVYLNNLSEDLISMRILSPLVRENNISIISSIRNISKATKGAVTLSDSLVKEMSRTLSEPHVKLNGQVYVGAIEDVKEKLNLLYSGFLVPTSVYFNNLRKNPDADTREYDDDPIAGGIKIFNTLFSKQLETVELPNELALQIQNQDNDEITTPYLWDSSLLMEDMSNASGKTFYVSDLPPLYRLLADCEKVTISLIGFLKEWRNLRNPERIKDGSVGANDVVVHTLQLILNKLVERIVKFNNLFATNIKVY